MAEKAFQQKCKYEIYVRRLRFSVIIFIRDTFPSRADPNDDGNLKEDANSVICVWKIFSTVQ